MIFTTPLSFRPAQCLGCSPPESTSRVRLGDSVILEADGPSVGHTTLALLQ